MKSLAELRALFVEAEQFARDEPDRNSAAYHYLAGSLGIDVGEIRAEVDG